MSKCDICNRKLLSIMLDVHTCRCDKFFCGKHMHNHNCTFNYHKHWQNQAEKNMPKITKEKFVKI